MHQGTEVCRLVVCNAVALVMTALSITYGTFALAQETKTKEGPTTEETVAYINDKLSLCQQDFRQKIDVSDNRISISSPSWRFFGPERSKKMRSVEKISGATSIVTIDLGDLLTDVGLKSHRSFQEAGFDTYTLKVECAKADCIEVVRDPSEAIQQSSPRFWDKYEASYYQDTLGYGKNFIYSTVRNYSKSAYYFKVCGSDAAGRVRKALGHLIAQSGGRDELF